MGRKEGTVELLVKVWEGIRQFLEVPKESTGSFFRHMRVDPTFFGWACWVFVEVLAGYFDPAPTWLLVVAIGG